jgi:hypothetical protein
MAAPTNDAEMERLAEALARLLADYWRRREQQVKRSETQTGTN